ncbi:ABC transporter permease [Candidatus Clostridium radicumherbarum]|uniref:ABC transporter permease n=1 Tax=Candidatus Clostridium radicumherbarum TaxID=3381662 RepID=A0ABW8TMP7_9CLOT
MGEFKATLINELERLSKKKKGIVAVILSLICIIAGQVMLVGLRTGFGLRGAGSGEFPILILSVVVNSILPLFTALVTVDSFSGEFSQNTMKISLTRPVTRLKFFTAKLSAIMIFVAANLLVVMFFSIIVGLMFNTNSFTLHSLIKILISYLVTLMPMLVLTLVIITLANIFRSGTSVFFMSILIFIAFKALGIVFSRYSGLLFTSMLDWYNLWLMNTLPLSKIIRDFLLMSSYVIILFTGSYYLFDKKDF